MGRCNAGQDHYGCRPAEDQVNRQGAQGREEEQGPGRCAELRVVAAGRERVAEHLRGRSEAPGHRTVHAGSDRRPDQWYGLFWRARRHFADCRADIPALTEALIQHPTPFKPFLPLLKAGSNAEDTIPLLTSSVLSKFLSYALVHSTKTTSQIDEALPQLYNYLSALAKSQDAGLQDIAVQEYSAVLRNKKSREVFWEQRKETLNPLIDILTAASGASKDQDSSLRSGAAGSIRSVPEGLTGGVGLQLLYHVLLVIWQLSFEGELVGDGLQEYVTTLIKRLLTNIA